VRRLRSLSEAECYARCYGGGGGEATVRLVRLRAQRLRPAPTVTGERVRQLFEERLDARSAEAA
jgi:hypothetical protein